MILGHPHFQLRLVIFIQRIVMPQDLIIFEELFVFDFTVAVLLAADGFVDIPILVTGSEVVGAWNINLIIIKLLR